MTSGVGTTYFPQSVERRFSGRQGQAALCVGSMALFIVASLCVCAYYAGSLVNEPFAGFFVNQNLKVGTSGSYHWTGTAAGLMYPDKILEANHQPLRSPDDLKAVVRGQPVGAPITYLVARGGQTLELSVPTMRFGWGDYGMTFGMVALTATIYLILGGIVFILKPFERQTWSFLAATLLLSLYTATSFDIVTTLKFIRLHFLFHAFVPAAFVHFSFYFPRPNGFVLKHPWSQAVPYAVSLLLIVPLQILNPHESAVIFLKLINLYLIIASLCVLYPIITSYIKPDSVLARQRAKVVLFGAGLAFPIPTSAFFSQVAFGSFFGLVIKTNLLVLPLMLFPASIGYAIARHNLFDVDVYIKRTVGYVIMTSVVAGGYFLFQSLVKTTLLDPLLGASSEKVYPFLFALLTVFAFHPLSQRVQEFVDKLFYRKLYDYKTTVASLSESLTSLVDVQAFIDKVIHTVRADLFVDRAGVILFDERTNSSHSTFRGTKFGQDTTSPEDRTDPCVSPDDPLLVLLAREKQLITKYDVAEDPRYEEVRESCGQRFETLGASLAFPLYYRNQFAGALALGYKNSGHFYTREDIDLLKTLSTMTSTAIEQSREKGQKAVLMQLFSKHVSPSVAETLWEQREQFLEGGRPRSQQLTVTAMFTDLQGFSTISEKQTPEKLMDWLNQCMEMITNTVMVHGGVVDDFFGDGVKINFGVPVPRTSDAEIQQDAVNAVTCALALDQEMRSLNERIRAQGFQPLRMRIGIFTGPVVAGSLGSADRMKYTTIGDTVNTAARLESFDKELVLPRLQDSPCRILIGESTCQHIKGMFEVEKVGELSLKGKSEKVGAYCVLGRTDEKPAAVSVQQTNTPRAD